MGNLAKKIRDEKDKKILKERFGIKPKHRCPKCHRFSIWLPKQPKRDKQGNIIEKVNPLEKECVMCRLIELTREEYDEEIRSSKSNNSGE